MAAVTAVDELRAALEALEALISVRLEERRTDAADRPLETAADDPLPPLERYGRDGPLATAVTRAGLTSPEALVLLAALAPCVDEKFDVLFGRLTDRPGSTGLTGEVARTLMARTFAGRLHATALLGPTAPLRASGLLTLEPPGDLTGRLVLSPELRAWLLGLPVVGSATAAGSPARPLDTVHTLDDVVLPGSARRRVAELVDRIACRDLVVEDWGFGAHHDGVSGLIALFHGPPGTGKTMTAAALARTCGLPAYVIDLSALVSKYIGETEKHLAAVFDRAAREQCVLVFDEADAVFGKRTEVSDAHDRYANQEVSYLLSRVERHPGVVVLTTNLLANIDEAFLRRIHVAVEFPSPGPAERSRLWRTVLPKQLPVDTAVDLDRLAQGYDLTGAQIRDASLDAAYRAAAEGQRVREDHLLAGIRRQYEKSGRTAPR
ncbi:ATP-binding protein [Streptomyces sp. SKN60]|uniref:ATP-binding protein n=1 Tax=Streptomyces sp. SKN60 TaxID=2855506 RepID=UPI0022458198|nr:ATP-binding protein [Streptomyces sp. SKN60]MCX2183926.1 ATP-binding protein [Streptomyces sp. SKN60]